MDEFAGFLARKTRLDNSADQNNWLMRNGYRSQEQRILTALEEAGGAFVSLHRLGEVSGSMNVSKRISVLGLKYGYNIENRTLPDPEGGFKKFSSYRLIKPTTA